MIFRQLFEPESSTYTYLLGCRESGKCVLIDPVLEAAERDLALVRELGLTLELTLETHIHADHVSSAGRLRSLTGCKVAYPAMEGLACADIGITEEKPVVVGSLSLQPLFTPGHTDTHHCLLLEEHGQARIFSGDALLIDGCGRTDFQNGSAEALYRSIHAKIFPLPEDTLVYPAHDYQYRHVSTIAQERERNPRLGGGKTLPEFVKIMVELKLPYPEKIDVAVPANLQCGVSLVHAADIGGKAPQG